MNILFRLANADTWTEAQVYEKLGEPIRSEVLTESGIPPCDTSAPAYVVESPSMSTLLSPSLLSGDITVIDFGTAFFLSHRDPPLSSSSPSALPTDEDKKKEEDNIPIAVGIPAAYAAPEVMFDNVASKASDVWALACTIFHMRAGFDIFESYFGGYDEALGHMVCTLGKLPYSWWRRWEGRKDQFDDHRELCSGSYHVRTSSVKERVLETGSVDAQDETDEERVKWARRHPELAALIEPRHARPSEADADSMANLLDSALKYQPEQRSSAQEIAGHPWLIEEWQEATNNHTNVTRPMS